MPCDCWAEWILDRRFGGDEEAGRAMLERLGRVRDRVLDGTELRRGETLLDVGCGDGLIGFGALERGAGRVVFSDVSQDLLDVVAELAAGDPRCELVLARAQALAGVGDASVDVVTTRSVIIYVDDKRAAFAEFFRVLRPGGRLSMFEPINRFASPEPDGFFLGVDLRAVGDLVRRVRARYEQLSGSEASIARGRLWGSDPPPLDSLFRTAPNPNAPTFDEVLGAELNAEERERFLGELRPRYEAGELTGRSAVAYLRARKQPDEVIKIVC